jgi:3-carboxy-cis,cis-muconate cycloisomerase
MTSVQDSLIFGNILSHPQTAQIWNDRTRTSYFLEFEAALAKAQSSLSIIPAPAADAIVAACSHVDSLIDWDLLKKDTETIGYPVLGVVRQLVMKVNAQSPDGEAWGEWSHWGATTQDVTDTATVLQIRDTLGVIERLMEQIMLALQGLAEKHKATPMAGRSNLQQAVPVSAGFKFARLLATFMRHKVRLGELKKRISVIEFGGAAGTLASLSPDGADNIGLRCQEELAKQLGLSVPDTAWHTERDRIAEFGFFCTLLTATCSKFALDLKLEMQTEVAEMKEPYVPHRGSSSTMPQKRNPIGSVYVTATAATVRQLSAALAESMVGDHERSTGPWEIEWITLPQISTLTAACLRHTAENLQGLEVDELAMKRNLMITKGAIVSEAVIMGLGSTLGRQKAHDVVYDLCREANMKDVPLLELLDGSEQIALPRSELERLCDPRNYLGLSEKITEQVLTAYRGL